MSSITPPDFGGGGLSAYKLAARLARTGQLAFLVTRSTITGRKDRVYKDLAGLPEIPPQRVVRVAAPRSEGKDGTLVWRSLRSLLEMPMLAGTTFWQLVRRYRRYDILHCFTANWLSFFAICVGTLLRKRTILELTLLGRDDPGAVLASDLFGIKKTAKRIQFRLADALICLSPALVQRCLEAGIPPEKVHLVPRPVDLNRFRPADPDERVEHAARLALSGRWPIVLFVGGVSKRKGADLLLPIFFRIVKAHPDALLLIIGTPDDERLYEQMQDEIRHLDLPDAVRFIERTGRIEEYMCEATVFLLPTRREGFANVLVEAMACSVPVVTRLIPGITDFIIENLKDGFVVPGDDPEPFARAILDLLENDELRQRIGAAGRETVRARFRTEIIDGLYQQLYDQLAATTDERRDRRVVALSASSSVS